MLVIESVIYPRDANFALDVKI